MRTPDVVSAPDVEVGVVRLVFVEHVDDGRPFLTCARQRLLQRRDDDARAGDLERAALLEVIVEHVEHQDRSPRGTREPLLRRGEDPPSQARTRPNGRRVQGERSERVGDTGELRERRWRELPQRDARELLWTPRRYELQQPGE